MNILFRPVVPHVRKEVDVFAAGLFDHLDGLRQRRKGRAAPPRIGLERDAQPALSCGIGDDLESLYDMFYWPRAARRISGYARSH